MRFFLLFAFTLTSLTTLVFAQLWGWNNPGFSAISNLNAQIAQSQANADWSIAQANENVAQSDLLAAQIAAQSGNFLGAALDRQAALAAEQTAQQYRLLALANEQAARQDLLGGPFGGIGLGGVGFGGVGLGIGPIGGGFGHLGLGHFGHHHHHRGGFSHGRHHGWLIRR